jgi:hypothetical protein
MYVLITGEAVHLSNFWGEFIIKKQVFLENVVMGPL